MHCDAESLEFVLKGFETGLGDSEWKPRRSWIRLIAPRIKSGKWLLFSSVCFTFCSIRGARIASSPHVDTVFQVAVDDIDENVRDEASRVLGHVLDDRTFCFLPFYSLTAPLTPPLCSETARPHGTQSREVFRIRNGERRSPGWHPRALDAIHDTTLNQKPAYSRRFFSLCLLSSPSLRRVILAANVIFGHETWVRMVMLLGRHGSQRTHPPKV